jgi:hypothetical protein
MKTATKYSGLGVCLLLVGLVSSGCVTGEWGKTDAHEIFGSGPKTLIAVASVSRPPPSKALVNFHFPLDRAERFFRSIDSVTGGDVEKLATPGPGTILIFDESGRLLIRLESGSVFQYVCDPGKHLFIAWLTRDYGGVEAVSAEVAPDRVYDILAGVTPGLVSGGRISLVPITNGHPKRAMLPKIDKLERFAVALNAASPRVAEFEAAKREHIQRATREFVGGVRSHLLLQLHPEDGRTAKEIASAPLGGAEPFGGAVTKVGYVAYVNEDGSTGKVPWVMKFIVTDGLKGLPTTSLDVFSFGQLPERKYKEIAAWLCLVPEEGDGGKIWEEERKNLVENAKRVGGNAIIFTDRTSHEAKVVVYE